MQNESVPDAALTPYPPSSLVASEGGVGAQTAALSDGDVPHISEAPFLAPDSQTPAWPSWAPPLPTDIPPPLWQQEGRAPRPEELLPTADARARSPRDYGLPGALLGDSDDPQALAHGRALQSLLWASGMPAHEGAFLLEEVARIGPGELSDVDLALKVRETEGLLRQRLGESEFTRQRSALTAMLERLDVESGGALGDFLADHAEVFFTPMVFAKLMAHAGRAEKRGR